MHVPPNALALGMHAALSRHRVSERPAGLQSCHRAGAAVQVHPAFAARHSLPPAQVAVPAVQSPPTGIGLGMACELAVKNMERENSMTYLLR